MIKIMKEEEEGREKRMVSSNWRYKNKIVASVEASIDQEMMMVKMGKFLSSLKTGFPRESNVLS